VAARFRELDRALSRGIHPAHGLRPVHVRDVHRRTEVDREHDVDALLAQRQHLPLDRARQRQREAAGGDHLAGVRQPRRALPPRPRRGSEQRHRRGRQGCARAPGAPQRQQQRQRDQQQEPRVEQPQFADQRPTVHAPPPAAG
jgi:hypothetical protein